MRLSHPYLLFLGDAHDDLAAKTAAGIAQWRPEWCLGQLRLPGCQADLGLPDLTLEDAAARGVKTLVVGVVNRGGIIPDTWLDTLRAALAHGMDIASGLHKKLTDIPDLVLEAQARGRQLADVRHHSGPLRVGTGEPRTGRRLLTVGSDCSVGKMYTALALEAALKARGKAADFRATGQTGILIAGEGVSVDAVISDFISGATEQIAPAASDPEHWDLVEGQGSLFHPSYAGVSLGLLHGAQAEALVMCHEPRRPHMRGLPHQPLPDLADCIALNERCARLTCPTARVVGFALNTSKLSDAEADAEIKAIEDRFGLPCCDPVRTGVDVLLPALGA